jgi:DNA-binding transcriptional MerR regulator
MDTVLEPVKLSKSQFDQHLRDFRESLEHPDIRTVFLTMCNGSENTLTAFNAARGMGIAVFSRLMKLPVTTVRHYVELGLINPFSVHGKFFFTPFNVPQVESVRQWRDLGLSLEEIRERRRQLSNTVLLAEHTDTAITINGQTERDVTVQMLRHQSPEDFVQSQSETQAQRKHSAFSNIPALRENLRLEYAQVIEKLEQKKLEIERKLEKAKKLRENLELYSPVANPV